MKPTAAPAYFPYAHRTMAEMPAYRMAEGGTMLAKGWAVRGAKLRVEPLPVWREDRRQAVAAHYAQWRDREPLYFVSVPG